MSNEPSRRDLERHIIAQYNATAKKSAETDMPGMTMAFRGAMVAYASVLFYMRTGMNHIARGAEFKAFMQQMDAAARKEEGR